GMLGNELDPVNPDFLFSKILILEFIKSLLDLVCTCRHKVIMEDVLSFIIHDVFHVIIDVELSAAVDDLFYLMQKLGHADVEVGGDFLKIDFSVHLLDDGDFHFGPNAGRLDHHVGGGDYIVFLHVIFN